MRRHVVMFAIAAFLVSLRVGVAQVTTGTISGTVTDSTGAVVAGAKVVVDNQDTGASRTVVTDASGRYMAPSLSLGNYKVTTSMEGFQTEVRSGIVLTIGREAVVNMQLSIGAVTQTVEVAGEAPLVETTQATLSYLANDRTIRELPLNGRDMTQLILLNPGVNEAVNAAGTSAFQGWAKKVSISGARSEDSTFLLDGTYIADMNHHIPSGPSGALLGVETVREFQVLTNSFGAQYGRTMGGVLNAVSKSGTNDLHGDLYEFLRNSKLDARNFFDRDPSNPTKRSDPPPFKRNQFGGTLGGPIATDKTFFFLAYEGMRERLSTTKSTVVPDEASRTGRLPNATVTVAQSVRPFIELFPMPTPGGRNYGDGTAEYIFVAPQPTQDDFGQTRIDHQLSANDSMFGRFTISNSQQEVLLSYPGYVQIPSMHTRLFTLSDTHIISPTKLLVLRTYFNRVNPVDEGSNPTVRPDQESVPGQGPPSLSPSGITANGGQYGVPRQWFTTNRFGYMGDINHTVGAHALQYGGMLERLQFNQSFPNRPYGTWQFGNLQSFLQGVPNRFRGTPPQYGDSIAGARQWFGALYIQDDWRLSSKLTVNLGVRWEPYSVPTEVNGKIANQRNITDFLVTGDPLWKNKSWFDIGPRFGFAYNPLASGTLAIRGGFGITFLPNDPNVYRNELNRNTVVNPELNFAVTPATNMFPNGLAQVDTYRAAGNYGQSPAIIFENFKTPRVYQYNLNVQQQIGSTSVVVVGFAGSRGVNQTSFSDYNAPLAVFDGESLMYPVGATRFNPKFDAINFTATNANAWYNALNMSYQRRFASGFQGQVGYTWAKALSMSETAQLAEYSGGGAGPMYYAHDPKTSKGLSGFGVAHTLTVNYSYNLPFGNGMTGAAGRMLSGWQLTGIVAAQTGQPFALSRTVPTAINAIFAATTRPNRDMSVPWDKITSGTTAGCAGVAAGQKLGTADLYLDPCAFYAPTARQLGNLGRNVVTAPGIFKLDFGLTKETGITERTKLQFRAEGFNILNRANLGKPASNLFTATNARVGSTGQITNTVGSARQVQLSLKLLF